MMLRRCMDQWEYWFKHCSSIAVSDVFVLGIPGVPSCPSFSQVFFQIIEVVSRRRYTWSSEVKTLAAVPRNQCKESCMLENRDGLHGSKSILACSYVTLGNGEYMSNNLIYIAIRYSRYLYTTGKVITREHIPINLKWARPSIEYLITL